MSRDLIHVVLALAGAPMLGGLLTGLDRILTARLQARIGPPLLQPFYDVIKLLAKEKTVVNIWQAFCAYSYLVAAMISVSLFFLGSDLLLILFIQATGAVFLVVGALASTAPFSQVGAHRELLQILSYEPLIILVVVGIFLETGGFKISQVYALEDPLLVRLPFLFLVLGYVLCVKLRKSPFDLSTSHHAHQELVKGVLTDYSGSFLAFIEIGHWFDTVLVLGLCTLFWATHWAGALLLPALTFLLTVLLDNVVARMNWRWMLGYTWAMGMALAFVNLIWIYLR